MVAKKLFGSPDGRSVTTYIRQSRVGSYETVRAHGAIVRSQVAELYASSPTDAETVRGDAETALRQELAALPLTTRSATKLARHARLNDACLAARGTYTADMSRHEHILRFHGGDLRAFVLRLEGAAESKDPRSTFFESARSEGGAGP